MKIDKESVSPTEITLNIAMNSEDEEPFLNRSYRRVVNRVQIPGFRKGKAPRSIVESYVGRTALMQEALEFLVPETLDRVLKEQELQAFVEPDVELLGLEPISFKAVVALEPVVDLGNYETIHLQQPPVEISEEQVNDVIERLRHESTPWEPANRPAQFGDMLTVDVAGKIEDEDVLDDYGVDYVLEEAHALPFPGFAENLVGLSDSDTREFSVTVPEDYAQTSYAGKECEFRVKALSVKEKKLPELDDEFAKGVGDGFESIDALREHVRNRLIEEAKAAAERSLEEEALQELVKIATVNISPLIYQREVDMMREERERTLRNQRLDIDTYLRYIGKTEAEFTEEMRPRAQERLTSYLVLRKLAEHEGIEVTEDEVKTEIETLIESSSPETWEQMRQVFSSERYQDSIRSNLLNRKIMERLREIVLQPADEPEADGSDGTPESTAAAPTQATKQEGSEEGAKPNAD